MYVPRSLVLGRCWRCGKRIYRFDDYFVCTRCNALYCPTCTRKTFQRCPACSNQLVQM